MISIPTSVLDHQAFEILLTIPPYRAWWTKPSRKTLWVPLHLLVAKSVSLWTPTDPTAVIYTESALWTPDPHPEPVRYEFEVRAWHEVGTLNWGFQGAAWPESEANGSRYSAGATPR